jgi:hypothetical protein
MHDDGFLVLHRAVSTPLVRAARRAVNASIGALGIRNDSPDRTSSGNPRVRGPFDALGREPVILDLLCGSDVYPLLESALGGAGTLRKPNSAQIRLCFPADPNETLDIDMGVRNDAIPHNGW